ncbi:MAG: methylenetetrahydrofolate dehydrogenase (NADP+)/methenyltetrahydrofolate cyclohydrolase [Nitriliruptoraceae bacterium]
MTATIIDGKDLAARVRDRIALEVAQLQAEHGVTPGLAAVLVGDDHASEVYVGMKHRDCVGVGMHSRQERLPATATQAEVEAVVAAINADDSIDGLLVQLPLPAGLDERQVQRLIAPDKDVDALHPITAGQLAIGEPTFLSCTPYGCVELLKEAGVELAGAEIVVVGRSNLVGRPLSTILGLKGYDATVTMAHSRTVDLAAVTRRADVVIAAVGREGLITADMIKPGAVVIDVGTNRAADGRLVGDVDFEGVSAVAGAITPVPGGVGPMTRAMLLQNTLEAARARRGIPQQS